MAAYSLVPNKSSLAISGSGRGRRSSPSSSISSSIAFPILRRSSTKTRLLQFTRIRGRGISRVLAEEESQLQLDPIIGGGGGFGNDKGGGGGGGDKEDGNDEFDNNKKKMATGMSMSQKLTLGYAALVGVGGIMGYVKSGSQKSLAAGGLSALLLFYVYTQLPVKPAFASSLGFGLSAALLGVMGSRFKSSGKIFPAGLVSFVSFVMTGGYLHGILRSFHA